MMRKLYTLLDENGFVINAQFYNEGEHPENAIEELNKQNFLKAKFDFTNRVFYEGATPEEIAEYQDQQKENFVMNFLEKKKADGLAYASDVRFAITKELIGKPIVEVNEIDSQCKQTVMPLLQLIEGNGADFWTAMNVAIQTTAPTNEIALKYFESVKDYIVNYVQTNYPKEL